MLLQNLDHKQLGYVLEDHMGEHQHTVRGSLRQQGTLTQVKKHRNLQVVAWVNWEKLVTCQQHVVLEDILDQLVVDMHLVGPIDVAVVDHRIQLEDHKVVVDNPLEVGVQCTAAVADSSDYTVVDRPMRGVLLLEQQQGVDNNL